MNSLAITTAIRRVLTGYLGETRRLTVEDFLEGQPADKPANKAIALTAPAIDVKLGASRRSQASPLSASASRAIKTIEIEIAVTWALPSIIEANRRYVVRAGANELTESAVQALGFPGNLSDDGGTPSVSTGLVSGMLFGPGDEPIPSIESVEEDWDKLRMLVTIGARAEVVVTQNT